MLAGAEVMGAGWVYSIFVEDATIDYSWGLGSWGVPGPNPARVPLAGPGPGDPAQGPKTPKMGVLGRPPGRGLPYIKDRFLQKKAQKRIAKHGLDPFLPYF